MKKLFFFITLFFTILLLNAQELSFPQDLDAKLSDALKEQIAQYIDEKTDEAIKKASENDELGNKSGFVLGASLGLKCFDAKQIIQSFQELSSKTPSLNGGIVVGYQYFF